MNITFKNLIKYIKAKGYKVNERIRAIRIAAEVFEEYEDYLRIKGE